MKVENKSISIEQPPPSIMGRTTEKSYHEQEWADLGIEEPAVEPFEVGETRIMNGDEINNLPEPAKYLVDQTVLIETNGGLIMRYGVYQVTRLSDDPSTWVPEDEVE